MMDINKKMKEARDTEIDWLFRRRINSAGKIIPCRSSAQCSQSGTQPAKKKKKTKENEVLMLRSKKKESEGERRGREREMCELVEY